MNFVQTTSIVGRFRFILVAMSFLLILEFLGFLLSSQTLRTGIHNLREINSLTDFASQGGENLKIAIETIEKTADPKSDSKQLETIYSVAKDRTVVVIDTAIKVNSMGASITHLFLDAKNSTQELNNIAEKIFQTNRNTPKGKAQLKKQLLLAHEFELDASESLRGAEIELSKVDTMISADYYRSRLTPLVIAYGIALIALFIGLIFGHRIIQHLNRSLGNLLKATDAVSHGDLAIHPPVLAKDELGRLTVAFENMVQNLDKSLKGSKAAAERNSRLLNITAAFSRAVDLKSVAGTMLYYGIEELDAKTGIVGTLSESGEEVELLTHYGLSDEVVRKFSKYPLSAQLPSAEAIRTRESIFIESKEEFLRRYPIDIVDSSIPKAAASAPLMVDGNAVGALRFSFDHEKKFTKEERNFIVTLADLAAQAFQRASLYNQAQKAIRVRDEFLSIASHELKTPITSLKMQLQLALRQTKQNQALSPEKLNRMLQSSINQVDRLTSLVEDLLDVSRIEAGKLSLHFTVFDLRDSLKNVLERFEEILKSEGCPATLLQADSAVIEGDTFRIEQVIINLLSNAMKYGSEKPIEISLVKTGSKAVELSVRDHGIGIPPEKQAIIFERFERASDTDKVGGLGLGLYIAHQIIEAHHGTIRVESATGKGSAFIIELPLHS